MSKKVESMWHLFLYFGLVVGFLGVYLSRFDATRQFVVLALLVVFYLVWGYAFHHAKGDVRPKLIAEYLLIAAIALGAGYLVLVS